MSYFLKKTNPSKKGLYLQIYESYYRPGVGSRNKSYKKLGYVSDLIASGIDDPISFYQAEVDKLNSSSFNENSHEFKIKNIGYFLIKAIVDKANIDNMINFKNTNKNNFISIFKELLYAHSIREAFGVSSYETLLKHMYNIDSLSSTDIIKTLAEAGNYYKELVGFFNLQINKFFKREMKEIYITSNSYFFEIDLNEIIKANIIHDEFKSIIVGCTMVLDSELIPINLKLTDSYTQSYNSFTNDGPFKNQPEARKIYVDEFNNGIDKYIASVLKQENSGYIIAYPIKLRLLSSSQKTWFQGHASSSGWNSYYNKELDCNYSYKSIQSINDKGRRKANYTYYSYLDMDNNKCSTRQSITLIYNPIKAKMERAKILKDVKRLHSLISTGPIDKESLGELAYYASFKKSNIDNKLSIAEIDKKIVADELKGCGYTLLITSEYKKDPIEVYETYFEISKIKNSFNNLYSFIIKNSKYLFSEEAVNENITCNQIYGQFFIHYLEIAILRLLVIKYLNNKVTINELKSFIAKYSILEITDKEFINLSTGINSFRLINNILKLAPLSKDKLSDKDLAELINLKL